MEGITHKEKIIWSYWEEKSPRDVVREAAAKGTHIELAITYLISKNSWSESTARDWFMAEVKTWTIQLLMGKQIHRVLHILNKVNLNPEEHLMTIAEVSPQIDFRDFIVENIKKLVKDMNPDNIPLWNDFNRHWNLLRYLEKAFECDGTFKQNKVFGTGKERIIVNESEIKALTIENIKKYPMDWKRKIATTLFFSTFDFTLLDFSTPSEIWKYLVEQNKAMILVRWINVQTSEVVRDMNARYNFFNNEGFVKKLLNVDTTGFEVHVLDNLDEVFRKWPITNEMIDFVCKSNCYAYTKMCIYDTLCSYGIVIEDERNNLYQIIGRLARTQNMKLIDDIFSESCSTISKEHFYVELAKYCVKNKLYKVMTMCVEGNILDTDLSDVERDAKECIELWLLFKSIEQTSDRQSHVLPVYKTCEQIARGEIDKYISLNPQLVIGMILLEDATKLFDIFSKEEFLQFTDFKLSNRKYKDKLPHLFNVFRKHSDPNQTYENKDVNVYQLLSGYSGLDVSKIFEFQLVNQNNNNIIADKPDRRSLGSLLPSDVDVKAVSMKGLSQKSVEMPDFANEKLMKRFGYVAKLNHNYYLKQYRPCNASQAFVAQQYQMYSRLQDKSIKSACCEAHALALQNWYDPAMAACAVSFIAMIGCNPTRCRVHMAAAKMMKDHMISFGITEDQTNEIVNDFMTKLIQSNDDTAREILLYLEEITLHKLKVGNIDTQKDILTVLYESQTMVKFAMLHNLTLPEKQLREFVKKNLWFNFLLFGDIFRYPLSQMLQLSQEFEKRSYAEHMKNILLHRSSEDGSEKDLKSNSTNGPRKLSRLNSVEAGSVTSTGFDSLSNIYIGRDLWEVAAACHGPEDPPAALLRAADICREPLLVLIASCYEPNAVEILWAQWVLSSIETSSANPTMSQGVLTQHVPTGQFQRISELCLQRNYVTTLHESMLIFMPESPFTLFTSFLHRCIRCRSFDAVSSKILSSFLQHCQRKYSVDSSGLPWRMSKESLQKISVALVMIALSKNFDSAFHQKEFLRLLVEAQFAKGFMVSSPNFVTIYEILKISMETPTVVNVAKMLDEDSNKYLLQCVEMYTANRNYDVALKIAKLAGVPVNDILTSEWKHKFEQLHMREKEIDDKDITYFIAECSESFKKASVTFIEAVEFLVSYVNNITDAMQKFYSYRVVMSWFEENLQYGKRREEIEHFMWDAYFSLSTKKSIFLNNYQSTLHYILNGQKDEDASRKLGIVNAERSFTMMLNDIEIESDVGNIENVVLLEEPESIDVWRKVINQLLELRLLVDAFRLSALFKTPAEYRYRPPACPVQIVRTCLKLAEGTCSPYELPQELRLVISSPTLQNKLSLSGISDASFEELVVIQEKSEIVPEGAHLAAREEADRLSALDALAVRSGLTLVKQVASYFRIALQVGWDYTSVLKYQNRSIDFINLVSGRARMSLANLVFRTFNIPSKQIAEYLCWEMVAAIISPHLVKPLTFRQKEHFQYTLWGYALNSDIEMFLNMRPDACSLIGRLILDHLMAFQKIYKAGNVSKLPDNILDDSCLDLETLIDEEYQNVEGEVESVLTEEGTMMSTETESVYSVSTVYTIGNKLSRDSRRNLFDVITKNNVHIRYEVKSNIRNITKGAKLSTKQVNIIALELLVLAHECFSCACDTEGVAVVLRSAQALAARLLAAHSWRLMVRLLTGLARYTECAYIFQALRDNHQFEYLLGQFDYMLGQQADKIAEFKQGLLDFLRTHCPGDTDTYIMVALHFNMYTEAANVKRKQALDLINDLEKMAMDSAKATSKKPFQPPAWLQIHDNVPTRLLLDTALNHCTDAAELYLQGGCTGFAGEMAALAQQLALQISLLDASPTRLILNRSTEQTYRLVSEYLSFMEGLVLLSGRGGEAWRELSYRRALANDQAYLRDMAAYRPDVAFDFLNRYKTERNKTTVSHAAMTELRNLCR